MKAQITEAVEHLSAADSELRAAMMGNEERQAAAVKSANESIKKAQAALKRK